MQEGAPLARGTEPVTRGAIVDPAAFEVERAFAFDGSCEVGRGEGPDRIDIHVAGQRFGKVGMGAGEDVHDAGRNVRGFQHLVEIGGGKREGFGSDKDRAVAHGDGRGHEGHQPEKWRVIRAEGTDHAHRFLHRQRDAANGHAMRLPVIFVGPGGIGEEAPDGGVHFLGAGAAAGEGVDAMGEFIAARRQVLGDVIEDLGAQVAGGGGPAFGGPGGLDGVADILAVGDRGLPEERAVAPMDVLGIATIGAGLFAADIELGGAVERICGAFVTRESRDGFERFGGALGFGVGRQTFPAAFAAITAFAQAAKAGGGIEEIGGVDPDHARGQFRGHIQGEVDVLAPERGGQPVAGVVGQCDGLARGAERGGNQNRTEDFLLHEAGRGGEAGDQGGWIETALCRDIDIGVIGLPFGVGGHHVGDGLQLYGIDHGAHVDTFVKRVAQAQPVHAGPELVIEAVGDAFLHQKTRPGAADLALVEPDGIDQPFDGAVDIGIVKDDIGGLAAQFQGQRFTRAGGRGADGTAHIGGAGKGDLVDVVMRGDHLAHGAVAGDDVDHPGGQAGLGADIGKQERGE